MAKPENTEIILRGNDHAIVKAKTEQAAELLAFSDRILSSLPDSTIGRQFIAAAVAEANALDRDVDKLSVVKSVFNCAILGLIPGPTLGHAYLIPRSLKGQKLCTLQVGYRGFLDLAFSNNFLRDVHADVILDGEEFEQWVDDGPHIKHKLPLNRDLRKPNVIGAYCVWRTANGGTGSSVVSRKEIDAVDSGKNVWASNYIEMCRKTPIRRGAKRWKITHRMGLAITLDEQAERGEPQTSFADLPAITESASSKPASFDDYGDDSVDPQPSASATFDAIATQIPGVNTDAALGIVASMIDGAAERGDITPAQADELHKRLDKRRPE